MVPEPITVTILILSVIVGVFENIGAKVEKLKSKKSKLKMH